MSGTYKATGINLKAMPLGESDRLITVLTREYGLIRAVAPGARKHNSKLNGRSSVFVVNELLLAKGKNLDKIIQAETLESYPGLSQDLRKLTASQYLAELVLFEALSEQPQEELFELLNTYLSRLETLPGAIVLPSLVHAAFQLLEVAGVAPEVNACCVTREELIPDLDDPDWRVGFSVAAGGTVKLDELERLMNESRLIPQGESTFSVQRHHLVNNRDRVAEATATYSPSRSPKRSELDVRLNAPELSLLQHLADPDLIEPDGRVSYALEALPTHLRSDQIWLSIERVLRHYAQYHFERPIRSAALIDTCFLSSPSSSPEP